MFGEELIVYSAHQSRTTTRTFRRLARAVDRNPKLGKQITRKSNRIGAELIELSTGQSIECVARSTQIGRGYTGDLIVLDEAHELDSEALAALLPMCSTRANPQLLYLLSQGNEGSWHLGGLRARALAGTDDYVTWVERSMADDEDPADRNVWAACNPAYPARISMEYLEREFLALGVEGFARERLAKLSWPTDADGTWEIISEARGRRATTPTCPWAIRPGHPIRSPPWPVPPGANPTQWAGSVIRLP